MQGLILGGLGLGLTEKSRITLRAEFFSFRSSSTLNIPQTMTSRRCIDLGLSLD